MRIIKIILASFFLVFLVGCSGEIETVPDFSLEYSVTCEETTGVLTGDYLILTEPETMEGMEFFISQGIVYVMYMDITKTSDQYPQIRNFTGSKIVEIVSKIKEATFLSPVIVGDCLEFNVVIDGDTVKVTTLDTGELVIIETDEMTIKCTKKTVAQ